MVLGHARCSGVRAAIDRKAVEDAVFLKQWINLLDAAKLRVGPDDPDALEHASIQVSLERLMTFPFVEAAVRSGKLRLAGARFSIFHGQLEILDQATGNSQRSNRVGRMKVRIAAAQYPIDPIASWAAYEVKIGQWVGGSGGRGRAIAALSGVRRDGVGADCGTGGLEQSAAFDRLRRRFAGEGRCAACGAWPSGTTSHRGVELAAARRQRRGLQCGARRVAERPDRRTTQVDHDALRARAMAHQRRARDQRVRDAAWGFSALRFATTPSFR